MGNLTETKITEGGRTFILALLLAAVWCSGCSFKRKPAASDRLRLALGTEPPVLDPALADTGVSVFVLRQVTSNLLEYDAEQRLVPSDAESFEWRGGGKVLAFKLRGDLQWSDGQRLTACHYRDAFVHALDPKVPATLAELLYDVAGAAAFKAGRLAEDQLGIRCDDAKRTLEFSTPRPFAQRLMHGLAFVVAAPFRKDLYAVHREKWLVSQGAYRGVSSGAYVIESWQHDRRVTLKSRVARGEAGVAADRTARIAEIDLPVVRDPLTAFAMYESGELDVVDELPPAILPKMLNRADRVVSPSPTTYFVGFSLTANPALRDVRVRKALAYSAGQSEIPLLLKGGEYEAKGWVYPDLLPTAYRPAATLGRPADAEKLLAAAGYGPGKKKLRLTLAYNNGERHQLLMERLRHHWVSDLGVEVELRPMEWKVLVAQIKANAPDTYRYAWAAVYPDALFFLELFRSDSLNNFGKWHNAEYDRILDELAAVPLEKRDAAFFAKVERAQRILVSEDPAIIPIYHYVGNALRKPDVRGLIWGLQGMSRLKNAWRAQ